MLRPEVPLTVFDGHYVAVSDLAVEYLIVNVPLCRNGQHIVRGIEAVHIGIAMLVS